MCDCIKKVNEQFVRTPILANTVLDIAWSFPSGDAYLIIATKKRDPKDKKRAKVIFPSFCPFCGEKLSTAEKEDLCPIN